MELQCNSVITDYTECPEVEKIAPILETLKPKRVLELGAGLGRVSVFLNKKYNWHSTDFYLLDGDTGDVQIAGLHDEVGEDFYNSFDATKEFCLANGMNQDKLHFINAEWNWNFIGLQFDLCYSFKAIGFHWPINSYLEKIVSNIRSKSYLFFEIRDTRRKSYPTEKHWQRRVNFVKRQLNNVDKSKYKIVEAQTDRPNPVLVLIRN